MYRHLALFNVLGLAIAGGAIQNLLISIPPQHGKSEFWSRYFPAWYQGIFPDRRVILASYEAGYAASWGRKTRDVLEEYGERLFGITLRQDSHAADDWSVEGHEGGMVTAGVGGPLTGRRGDVAIIDDPFKNAEEASSPARKFVVWDWWDSTLGSRMSKKGVRVVLMTRWAEDDLVGRILARAKETGETWVHIRLPAIAEEDEVWPQWKWERKKGEVLCPELFPLATMQTREKNILDYWWATLYQQRPYPREGGEIKSAWFQIVDDIPPLTHECRAWDLAASSDHSNKQTAGVRMGRTGARENRRYFITDIKADWWASGDRDKEIRQTAETDGKRLHVLVEQEPGSGGKSQAEAIARQLDGWPVEIIIAGSEGSKVLRADPMASAAKSGRVFIKRAPWNEKFLDQVRSFPGGKLIDMVDGAAHGFNWLANLPDPDVLPAGWSPLDTIPRGGQIFQSPGGRVF